MPRRLLLIDDDPNGLLALSEVLQRRLVETAIDQALSSQTALALLRSYEYHVIVSDIRMAGMDGLALLNHVRERWPFTPVILMTGAGSAQEGAALCNGAFAFIEKPLNLDRLLTLVNAAMSKSDVHHRFQEANRETLGLPLDPGFTEPL